MMLEKFIPNRLPGEKIVLFLRPHWLMATKHYILVLILGLIPILGYIFIQFYFPGLLLSKILYPSLLLVTSIYYLYIWLIFYNSFIDFYLDTWMVTNKRIIGIEQNGLFHREVYEHSLFNIQEVTGHQSGIIGTFLDYGDVNIQTSSPKPLTSFDMVPKPFEVAKQIQQLLETEKNNAK